MESSIKFIISHESGAQYEYEGSFESLSQHLHANPGSQVISAEGYQMQTVDAVTSFFDFLVDQ